LKVLYNETPVTLDIKNREIRRKMGKQELENVKTLYGLKYVESIRRMNNAVG
jgi:hypothetical protein